MNVESTDMTSHVVTANRLEDGAVVYLAEGDAWSEWIDGGRLAATKEEGAALLAAAETAVAELKVVAPYLIDVVAEGDTLRAVRFREHIRASGPPVRPDLGKQATKG
jgi:hypothetical protein